MLSLLDAWESGDESLFSKVCKGNSMSFCKSDTTDSGELDLKLIKGNSWDVFKKSGIGESGESGWNL